MTYIEDWDEFAKAAEELYTSKPSKVRFTLKYRHCDGKAVMKITDDVVCIKYQTEQAQDIKKLEKLNGVLMRLICAK